METHTFVTPQGGCSNQAPTCPTETVTIIHDETAKSVYSSIELLTSLLNRTRGSQPMESGTNEKADRTILRDASAIRSGAYRINDMVNQLASVL